MSWPDAIFWSIAIICGSATSIVMMIVTRDK